MRNEEWMLSHHESAVVMFFDRHTASMNGIAINVPQAQFMPKAIHESISFNSRNREVAIHSGVALSDNPAYIFLYAQSLGKRKRNAH